MDPETDLLHHIKSFEAQLEDYLPGNSIDCIILGYESQQLKVLLLKWKNDGVWTLPGGFIKKTEHLDDAAQRVLRERTGLSSVFVKQFYTFGSSVRNKNPQISKPLYHLKKMEELSPNFLKWVTDRFITTGYFALVDIKRIHPRPDAFSEVCEWKSLDALPPLILDHKAIITKALDHLKTQLNYLPIGISLLPKKFTMQDLRKLYEVILGKPLERSNFQRKLLKLGILIRHEKQMTGAANKAPYLYSFSEKKYYELIKNGIGFFS